MKYDFVCTVAGKPYDLIEHDVRLTYCATGRANFILKSDVSLKGLVHFSFSLDGGQRHGVFYGYVERCVTAGIEKQKIFCREKSNVLSLRAPIALRNTSLKDILMQAKAVTGLGFALPKTADYLTKTVPYFINTGSGFHLMQSIKNAFEIEDFVWQQRRDGLIYVGAWSDGHWPTSPIQLPTNLFDKHKATQSAEILAVPGLRPAFELNGNRLKKVDLIGNKMTVSWA